MKVNIVGGGIAGLTAAALLAQRGIEVHLFERLGQLGGRSFTLEKEGFTVNYGAHAVYAYDQSLMRSISDQLALDLDIIPFDPDKVKYEINNELTSSPAHLKGIFTTELLSGLGKFDFLKSLAHLFLAETSDLGETSFGEWMDLQHYREEVRTLLKTLATSNFFTGDPEQLRASQVIHFYQKMFYSRVPVSYMKGTWKQLIAKLEQSLLKHGGNIHFKSALQKIAIQGGKIQYLEFKESKESADYYVFAIPPEALDKAVDGTPIGDIFKPYIDALPTKVTILDIGFADAYDTGWPYIFDVNEQLAITIPSYYDPNIVPHGGQLLQTLAYLKPEDYGNRDHLEKRKGQLEDFVEQYFPDWKNRALVKRYVGETLVQRIQSRVGQKAVPVKIEAVDNMLCCGDWCESKEELSEISLDTAMRSVDHVMKNVRVLVYQ